jgi:hypothetical protein
LERALRPAARALVLAAALAVGACHGDGGRQPPTTAPPTLSPEQAAAARRTIERWLECDECVDGELEAVLRLGPTAVPTLVATLRAGVSPARRAELDRELRVRHAELAARAQGRTALDVETFVREQLAIQQARYQVRSAQALARIGGAEAKQALDDALARPLEPRAERAVRDARAALD